MLLRKVFQPCRSNINPGPHQPSMRRHPRHRRNHSNFNRRTELTATSAQHQRPMRIPCHVTDMNIAFWMSSPTSNDANTAISKTYKSLLTDHMKNGHFLARPHARVPFFSKQGLRPQRAQPVLSEAEIIRKLSIIRYSPRSSRQNGRPSISRVARYAGITREAIYLMFKTGSTGRSQARLRHALEQCEEDTRARTADHPS
jgi:hypothetical protein